MGYYHFFTDGRYQSLIFRDAEDFMRGMNAIAFSAQACRSVSIMAFCLMNNHVHFVLKGILGDVEDFAICFKKLVSIHLANKYKKAKPLHYAKSGFKEIGDYYHLKVTIAYCLRNPFMAGIVPHPIKYPWSSSRCYFSSLPCDLHNVGELGTRQYRELFKTRQKLPPGYLFDKDGIIIPANYISKIDVERLYCNEGSYYHYLMRRVENVVEGGETLIPKPVLPDHIIAEGLSAILAKEGVKDFLELPAGRRENVINELKYRYNISNVKQLLRVVGTTEHTHRPQKCL